MHPTIVNYGKTWRFLPAQVAYPAGAEELRAVVVSADKVRTMGSRHSWSKGIITGDTLVSLDKMNRILEVNKDTLQVRVEAGIKLKDLIRQLEQQGLALSNLGSIHAQSLAGAICTGTHGSGANFQCLAAQVESFLLMDAEGKSRTLGKGDPDFNAVLVGFGCFGIMYEITLNVVPCFQMHAITDTADFDEVIDHLDSYVKGYDHFKFWWTVPNDSLIVFKNKRTDEPRNDSDFIRWFRDEFLSVIVYRFLLLVGKLNRRFFIPLINKILTKEIGKKYERTCRSYHGFLTPSPPVHRETEWAFDYKEAPRLLREFRALLPRDGHTYNFVQEIRFTKADDYWLSPAYQRDSIWISMYNIDNNDRWNTQLAKFEAWARANGGRPHWGKEATLDPTYFSSQYEKIGDFRRLMLQYDPNGKFVNDWVSRIF